ncbi:MAG TPA: T9SS type A sorting domain-containing protein [Flavobacteriales bacterium]|jgi:hypothetical protein|nr:T9SS type A sorting domain-containing protein [Flavobacteriales bacterium]
MTRPLPLLAALLSTPLFAQISIVDFEAGASFDLTGVTTYCNTAAVQGSMDTYGSGSLWSLEFSPMFNNTCPGVASGLLMRLSGVAPGDAFTITHWQKAPAAGGTITNLVYAYPANGTLPADENDLVYVGPAASMSGSPEAWSQYTSYFELPADMPWLADVYFLLHHSADLVTMQTVLVDDIALVPDGSTDIAERSNSASDLHVAPVPAQDQVTITGLRADGGSVELFTSAGARVRTAFLPQANGTWDVQHLAPGVYVLRQGERWVRFVKA